MRILGLPLINGIKNILHILVLDFYNTYPTNRLQVHDGLFTKFLKN